MQVDVQEIEALSYLFLRVVGRIFLGPYGNAEANELTGAQKRILFYLDMDGPKKMSDIARLVAVTMPAATAVVDKLVKADLVTREADTSDRRVIRIALSKHGSSMISELRRLHEKRLREILERLEPEKRVQLLSAFEQMHDVLLHLDSNL